MNNKFYITTAIPYMNACPHISKKDLEKLYVREKLSTRTIAQQYGCGKTTIENRLREYSIAARSRSEALKLVPRLEKYRISREKLEGLYWGEKLSAYKIAEIYNCSPSAVSHKLRKFGIPRRTDVEGIILTNDERCRKIAKAVSRYPKKDFNASDAEKAYLIGFSVGDMNVRKKQYGETVYVASCTTKRAQVALMKRLFKQFGHIHVNTSKKRTKNGSIDSYHFVAYLNSSFDFLLDKKDRVERWVLKNDECFLSFLAGYIDAEGSFGVYNGFGEFSLGSYDKGILGQIHQRLKVFGVYADSPRIMVKGGYIDKRGVRTFQDLWSVRIRRKDELHKFVNLIEPYMKHSKRKRDLRKVKKNVVLRLES